MRVGALTAKARQRTRWGAHVAVYGISERRKSWALALRYRISHRSLNGFRLGCSLLISDP